MRKAFENYPQERGFPWTARLQARSRTGVEGSTGASLKARGPERGFPWTARLRARSRAGAEDSTGASLKARGPERGFSWTARLRARSRTGVEGSTGASLKARGPVVTESRASGRLPLIAAIIAVAFGAMALIGLREKIVRIMPSAAALYSAIGLKVNLAGLELRGLSSKIILEGSRKVLSVEGEIVNLRREANLVPPVALTVRGEDGQDKYAWTTRAPKARLGAGETVAFRARLASPPPDGAEVLARFAGLGTEARSKQGSTPKR